MGYTHYWKNPNGFTDAQWAQVVSGAKALLKTCKREGIDLAGGDGEGKPKVSAAEGIWFNGRDDESHETFVLQQAGTDFEFCKTARKEYDPAVVAMLAYAASVAPGFSWSSDGEDEDHAHGQRLAGRLRHQNNQGVEI